MTKAALRKIYKEKRRYLSFQEIKKFTDLILIHFQQIKLPFLSCIHTYIASEKLGEADTSAITRYLQFKNPGLKLLIPKIDITSGNMQHLHFDDEVELVHNAFGIAEPSTGKIAEPGEIDLVLVPLLAYDKHGYRVGYGKGYYDKFLSQCREDIIKIGLSFFDPVDEIDGIHQFDISLNYCVTPQRVYEFF
jgi:5-formyltetrahydrofolate cyclo-ligase